MNDELIYRFVAESNLIEGLTHAPRNEELQVTKGFLDLPTVQIEDLEKFVKVCQPGAELRIRRGMDVRVGDHRPPPGGQAILFELAEILTRVMGDGDPYEVHIDYETLHPFMDCNGRSGRVLWAWQMTQRHGMNGLSLGFLHRWYYQSLSAERK